MLKMEISKIIFDTDCLSSFLWTDSISILKELYNGKLKIPRAVYEEIKKMKKYKAYSFVYDRLEEEVKNGNIEILEIRVGSIECGYYEKIKKDYAAANSGKAIGEGEAEMLALAISNKFHCTLNTASNNLRDVADITRKEKIINITTVDILCEAAEKGLKTLDELNMLITEMRSRKRRLPSGNIEDFLKLRKKKSS